MTLPIRNTIRTALLGIILALPSMTLAQGQIFIEPPQPGRVIPPLPIKQHLVKVDIVDQAATTKIEQTFINQTDSRLEGTYVFPVPQDVSLSKLTMVVNGEPVEAKVVEAKKARETYENIVRQQRDPALLEYVGRDLVRLRVFPIEPNSETHVTVEYEEVLPYDRGTSRYRFGFTHGGKTQQKLSSSRVVVNLETHGELKSVYSPSHDIDLKRKDEHKAKVKFSDENVTHKGDFELVFGVSPADVAMHVLSYRDDDDEDGYFMLLASPRVGLEDDERVSKRIVFVIDTSGSMGDDGKIDQAKDALRFCLRQLDEDDRFGLITFSDEVDILTDSLEDADSSAVDEAVDQVKEIEAKGGTNIDEALEEALQMLDEDDEAPAYVLFLTDGKPTVGPQNPGMILEHVKHENDAEARIFSFGVGFDVNTELLDRLATEHRAVVTYVRPKEDIEVAVSSMYGKISDPVLTDPEIDFDDIDVSKVYPRDLPDIFSGQQLVLFGKYEDGGTAGLTLTGKAGNKKRAYKADVEFAEESDDYDFIPRLWATRRIGYLTEQIQNEGEDKELIGEIKRLSKKSGIVTPWTSMLITDDMPTVRRALTSERLQERLGFGIPAPVSRLGLSDELALEAQDTLSTWSVAGDGRALGRVPASGGRAPGQAGESGSYAFRRLGESVNGVAAEGESLAQALPEVQLRADHGASLRRRSGTQTMSARPSGPAPSRGMMGGFGAMGGAAAVGQSMTVQSQLKGAETLGDSLVFFDSFGERQVVQGVQQVGEANYYQVGNAWVQDGFDFEIEEDKTITIKPYSQAYFDLLGTLPNLSAALSQGDHLYLHLKGQQIVIAEDGLETLTAKLLDALKKLI